MIEGNKSQIVLVFGFESLNKLGSTWNGRHELIDFF